MKRLFLTTVLLACPLTALAQTNAAPTPPAVELDPKGHPVPQPDPQTLALALTAAPTTPQPPPLAWWGWDKKLDGVQYQSDIVIGSSTGRPMHAEIAWPTNPPAGLMPAVIWVHGGAWQGESQKPCKSMYFATRGYFAASIEYRLAQEAKWPAQIQDLKLGVRWLRANAAKYHVDPNRIAVWGASAGGHLVSCLGTLNDPALDVGDYPGVSSKVQAVCDDFGPVDFSHGGPGVLFSQSFKENPALYLSASPYNHITPTQPPFLVTHGDVDYTVPYKESVNFVAAMLKAGAPVEFVTVHNGMHGFGPVKGGPNPDLSMGDIFARKVEFLDRVMKNNPNL